MGNKMIKGLLDLKKKSQVWGKEKHFIYLNTERYCHESSDNLNILKA